MNFYKKFFSVLLTSIFCFVLSSKAQQDYPVLANLQITPPYSLYLSDYSAVGSQKMQLNLFLKDLTKNNYPCRLRLKIEGFGISIYSAPDFYVAPFYLNASEMRTISGDELAPYLSPNNLVFQGLSLSDFQNTGGKLPEGVYRISIEVLDYFNKKVVSNPGNTILSAYLSYPPIINMPFTGSRVTALNPQNVLFQWTPRHTGSINAAYNVAYKFTLVEINPITRDPNDAMRSSVPFYETFTDQSFLVYGPAEPPLVVGNKYAAKVQAVEAEGKDIFINNGDSEVIHFTYGEACEVPNYVFAEVAGVSKFKVSWFAMPNQVSFAIRYREANNASAQWFEQISNETSYTIEGLRSGRIYEYQVKAQCVTGYGDYTPASTFQVPDESMLQGDLVCGQTQNIDGLDNDAITFLRPGMFFMAGSFPITITEVSGGNGVFSGKGTIGLPLFNKFNFQVTFDNVSINNNLKLINGKVSVARQSLDQAQTQLIADLTLTPDATGKVTAVQNNNLPNIINVTITNPTVLPVYIPASKTITFDAMVEDGDADETNNPTKTITIELQDSQPPYVFQDKAGQTYEVAKDGTVTNRGKMPAKELLAGSSKTAKPINNSKAAVTFSGATDQKYGFDKFNTELKSNARYNENYTLANDGTTDNRISWKSIESGKGDAVKAELTVSATDNSILPEKLQFKTGSGDVISSTRDGNTYTIQLMGAPAGTDKEIYAFYPTKEGDAGTNLGKLNIASFDGINKKVVIVPVNGASAPSAAVLKEQLNAIYKEAVVSWDVEVAAGFNNTEWDVNNNGLEVGTSGALSAYTAEQKKLASVYKKVHPFKNGTYYIFLVENFDNPKEPMQIGYMVRGGQVGFVKAGAPNLSHTIAHELGHGAFSLKHSWEDFGSTTESNTANLMDYKGGTQLWSAQWKYMRNPGVIFRPFEMDERGSYETDGHYSTVYLVSLMLGMEDSQAWSLAAATEDPDTDVHSDINFELDQTYAYPWPQKNVHSLTGGFHNVEELMTAYKFLATDVSNTKELGKLLHRYGDTYAHTKLDNLAPEDLKDRLADADDKVKVAYYINLWKDQAGMNIATTVNPWIKLVNNYIKDYGYSFLTNQNLQRLALGTGIEKYLHSVYLKTQPANNFVLYGSAGFLTRDHMSTDGALPDHIYIRPKWYLTYVKNLAALIAGKYDLDINKLDMATFDRMVLFAQKNKCSLKGIIDYEISVRQGLPSFYIPVFYAKPHRIIATVDAVKYNNYKDLADKALFFTKSYLGTLGLNNPTVLSLKTKETSNSSMYIPTYYYEKLWAYQIIAR